VTDFLKKYISQISSQYSHIGQLPDLEERLTYLVSPLNVTLPLAVYEKVQKFIQEIFHISHEASYVGSVRAQLSEQEQKIIDGPAKNHAVLMAYDFHYDFVSDQLSLIEINTNASSFLVSESIYKTVDDMPKPWGNSIAALKASFENELDFKNYTDSPRVAIMDQNIQEQKMYPEFLMYKSLFESWGWKAELQEQSSIDPNDFDLIYNRSTDFNFTGANSEKLLQSYLNGTTLFTPHPREYLLLAAKDRLADLAQKLQTPIIPPVFKIKNHPNIEQVWHDRKNLFFKPIRSFGSKGAYKGSSISRKTFNDIIQHEFLAQEFRPPGTVDDWKFDLRFYVYRDQIQLGCARIYRGQVTSFSTIGGGLSRLTFI
jgi:hypothetical protein